MSNKHRAEPMAPEERRRAIVAAIIPLLVQRGQALTTREMADAAGIAEGTIFKVFPDKAAVIEEAIRASIDPEPVLRHLSEIYTQAPLEIQIAEAARILFEQLDTVLGLLSVMRALPQTGETRHPGPPPFVTKANTAINAALTELFERHQDRLRFEPARAAAALRGLIIATGHPSMGFTERLSVNEVVEVLLNGITLHDETRVG
ncbi:MAG: TetR/AcrR family transcriptional regulator [Acidimicrobiia bacterium]